jgi:hypothetical protein
MPRIDFCVLALFAAFDSENELVSLLALPNEGFLARS